MIPTNNTETRESWVCRACSSTNAGWRIRCAGCGVIVGGSLATWAPPPRPVPAPTKRTARRALGVVGYVVGASVGFGAAAVGVQAYRSAMDERSVEQAEERVVDYLYGEGEKEFFAADSQFRATFPTVPQRKVAQAEVAGIAFEFTMYSSPLGRDGFSVGTYDMPSESPFDLNLSVNGSAAAVNGRVERATPTTWQGFEAMEAVISASGGAVVQMLVVRTPERVYILEVVSFSGLSDDYEAFKASFEITL